VGDSMFEGVPSLEGLLRHQLLLTQHVGKIKGAFELCDITSTPHGTESSKVHYNPVVWGRCCHIMLCYVT
jgi:hypothetical protein